MSLTLYHTHKSAQINERFGIIKFPNKNKQLKLLEIGFGNYLLDTTAKAQLDMWNYTKLKSFHTAKETI